MLASTVQEKYWRLSLLRKAKLTKSRESVGRFVSLAHLRAKTRALGGGQTAMAAQPGLLRLPQLRASGQSTAGEGHWQLARPSVRPSVPAAPRAPDRHLWGAAGPSVRRGRREACPARARSPALEPGGTSRPGASATGGACGCCRPGSAEAEAAGWTRGHRRAGTPRGPCAGRGDSCRLPAVTEFLRPSARRASFRKVAPLPATRSPGSAGTIEASRLDSPCPRGRRQFACGLVAGSSHCPSSLTDERPPLSAPPSRKAPPSPPPSPAPPAACQSERSARRGQRRRRGNGRERAGEGERERGAKLSPPSLPPSLPSSSLPPSLAPSPAPSLRSFCFSLPSFSLSVSPTPISVSLPLFLRHTRTHSFPSPCFSVIWLCISRRPPASLWIPSVDLSPSLHPRPLPAPLLYLEQGRSGSRAACPEGNRANPGRSNVSFLRGAPSNRLLFISFLGDAREEGVGSSRGVRSTDRWWNFAREAEDGEREKGMWAKAGSRSDAGWAGSSPPHCLGFIRSFGAHAAAP